MNWKYLYVDYWCVCLDIGMYWSVYYYYIGVVLCVCFGSGIGYGWNLVGGMFYLFEIFVGNGRLC